MNRQETKEKLISFCEGLHKEGLISNQDLKECRTAFNNTTSNLEKIGNIPLLNDNLKNYGMSKDQAINTDIVVLGTKKNILTRIVIYKNKRNRDGPSKKVKQTLYSTLETDTSANLLYVKELEGSDNLLNDKFDEKLVQNITFKLTKKDNGQYTIRNAYTNELLKVQMDKKVKMDGINETPSSLFNIKMVGRFVKFESATFPGYYINAQNPLSIVEGSIPTQNWQLEIIDEQSDEKENVNPAVYVAEQTRQLVNNYMQNYEVARMEYLLNKGKIKYIDILINRIKNIVGKNGILMKYMTDRVYNGELDMTKEDLMKIEASMSEEVINNEIERLENKKIDIGELASDELDKTMYNDDAIEKIYTLLDEAIESKKVELETLNKLMDKVNIETKSLNSKDDAITKQLDSKEDIFERSTHNNKIIEKQYANTVMNYRLFIGLFIVTICAIIYLVFKLVNRAKISL